MPPSVSDFVQWFRSSAPYIYAFRGRTFVVAFGGEVVSDPHFVEIVHDLNLLHSLGVRLVLVHGARPQIEALVSARGLTSRYAGVRRITDLETLNLVLEANGRIRFEVEALLSMGAANSPMANAQIRVAGGNFVTAKPMGVRDGVDLMFTGEVRKVDATGIQQRLVDGEIVLLPSLGNSPTGEIFNLTLEEVATKTAIAIGATKLIFLSEGDGVLDKAGELLTELSTQEAERMLNSATPPSGDAAAYLPSAVRACQQGVHRAHLVNWRRDGALLLELFTRDGVGTMVHLQGLDRLRQASIDDVGGILAIIEPLEEEGVLVRRSRELLENEIERFRIVEYDGQIVGCAALYPFLNEGMAELAGLAVHPDFRREGYGEALLLQIEREAQQMGIKSLFVLTTRTAHWFVERGFKPASVGDLPEKKQAFYNYQRRSQVYVKHLA